MLQTPAHIPKDAPDGDDDRAQEQRGGQLQARPRVPYPGECNTNSPLFKNIPRFSLPQAINALERDQAVQAVGVKCVHRLRQVRQTLRLTGRCMERTRSIYPVAKNGQLLSLQNICGVTHINSWHASRKQRDQNGQQVLYSTLFKLMLPQLSIPILQQTGPATQCTDLQALECIM